MKISIDFGTSFSLAATSYLGTKSILLPAGKYGIPSVFYTMIPGMELQLEKKQKIWVKAKMRKI